MGTEAAGNAQSSAKRSAVSAFARAVAPDAALPMVSPLIRSQPLGAVRRAIGKIDPGGHTALISASVCPRRARSPLAAASALDAATPASLTDKIVVPAEFCTLNGVEPNPLMSVAPTFVKNSRAALPASLIQLPTVLRR